MSKRKPKPCLRCGHSAEKHDAHLVGRQPPAVACSVQYCACPCYRGVEAPKRKVKW